MGITASPQREGTIRLADGRRLAYAEWGDLDGRPAVLFHGNPGSRLICPDGDATLAGGIRLVTFDRPGYGGSDPLSEHGLGRAPADHAALADALGLGPAPVIGWSSGGPYALACAIGRPDLVTSVALVSCPAPLDELPDRKSELSAESAALLEDLQRGTPAAMDEMRARCRFYVDDPTAIVALTLADEDDPDRALMLDPTIRAALETMWREGARQGDAGILSGVVATQGLPWGFATADVRRPTSVWHGEEDRITPLHHGQHLAAMIPGAKLRTYPGEGHLIALSHWADILDAGYATELR